MNQTNERKVSEVENVKETNTIDCVPVADLEKKLRSLTPDDQVLLIRLLRNLIQDEQGVT